MFNCRPPLACVTALLRALFRAACDTGQASSANATGATSAAVTAIAAIEGFQTALYEFMDIPFLVLPRRVLTHPFLPIDDSRRCNPQTLTCYWPPFFSRRKILTDRRRQQI